MKYFLFGLVFIFIESCKKHEENITTINNDSVSVQKFQKISDNEILDNSKRDMLKLDSLINSKAEITEIKKFIDSSLEMFMTDEFGIDYTEDSDNLLKQVFKISNQSVDSIGVKPNYKIEKTKIILNDDEFVVVSIFGKFNFIDKYGKRILTTKNIALGISENKGHSFKFLNVNNFEEARKTLSYKLTENQINSMKFFKNKEDKLKTDLENNSDDLNAVSQSQEVSSKLSELAKTTNKIGGNVIEGTGNYE
ncbi:hypothetical protein [Epilithonimonas tenax]|uniref:hypothetical protein n=1 Tax=Epilithonimonas tenax TaxID=191577 RepID=UPI000411A2C3|nr:hypothetical protein [Epilithonimonas tenax]